MNELERAPLAGERYETVAPDTLDLAERARMAINGLLGICDPNMDFMPYGVFHLDCRRPHLAHWASADNTCGTKILESIPLLRLMSGSEQHLDLEAGMRDAFMSRIRDGHFWDVVDPRRPWRNIYNDSEKRYGKGKDEDFSVPIATARMMRTILVYRQLTGDKAFDKLAAEMSAALCRIAVVKDDYAYYPEKGGWCEPTAYPQSGYLNFDEAQCDQEGAEGSILCYQGSQIYAVSHWYKLTGDERALELARRLTRYCMKPKFWGGRPDPDPQSRVRSGLFIETGFIAPPLPDPAWSAGPEMGHWCSHFHARAIAVRGMLEYAMAANDARTLEFVRRFYEFSLTQGIAKIGYIDTHPSSTDECEGCGLGDLVGLGIRLSDAGASDYWDDVDAAVRNQLTEQQFTRADLLEQISAGSPVDSCCTDSPKGFALWDPNVIPRVLGSYSAFSSPTSASGKSMICCHGNATQGLYYVWEGIVRESGQNATVNLLLNRAAKLLDIESHLPYEGKVVIRNKSARRVTVRIPAWVDRRQIRAKISPSEKPGQSSTQDVPLDWMGNHLVFTGLAPGNVITLTFPVPASAGSYTTNYNSPKQRTYQISFRGSTVVDISPRDTDPLRVPIYLRDHMKATVAPTRKFQRFVADKKVAYW